MRATGIVRRIDELGRVVIPKEIRRNLRIREGEPLEIFTETDGKVVFRKYSPIGEISEFASHYTEAIYKAAGIPVVVCDIESVIAVSGISKKDFLEQRISSEVAGLIEKRQPRRIDSDHDVKIIADNESGKLSYFAPIIGEGNILGAIMSVRDENKKKDADTEKSLIDTAAYFLSRQMEV